MLDFFSKPVHANITVAWYAVQVWLIAALTCKNAVCLFDIKKASFNDNVNSNDCLTMFYYNNGVDGVSEWKQE